MGKICVACRRDLPQENFDPSRVSVDGTVYYRRACQDCYYIKRRERIETNGRPPSHALWVNSNCAKKRQRRLDPSLRFIFIWEDSRAQDRKVGRQNTLTREFIRETISHGCEYCGETELQMTLDRKDNSIGHIPENVVPACVRCNHARRDMPYEAWLCLVPGLREARRRGLFGKWAAGPVSRKLMAAKDAM